MIQQFVERLTNASVVGLDIDSTFIKAAEVISLKGQLILRKAVVRAIEKQDPVLLLKQIMVENDFKTTHVALGLASPEVIVHPFQFPRMPKKELAGAIRLEAEHAVLNGHVPDKMAVDWHRLDSRSENLVRGLLAVVPKEIISAQIQTAKSAGLVPVVVDVKGLALWNVYWALAGSKEPEPKTVLLIYMGDQSTHVVIAKGPDELILVRDIEIGVEGFHKNQKSEWVSEIYDSVVYARSKSRLRALASAYVTGGGALFPEILKTLESQLAISVKGWNPLEHIARDAGSKTFPSSNGPMMAIAMGLALRSRQ